MSVMGGAPEAPRVDSPMMILVWEPPPYDPDVQPRRVRNVGLLFVATAGALFGGLWKLGPPQPAPSQGIVNRLVLRELFLPH
jgi:hypothetical protein